MCSACGLPGLDDESFPQLPSVQNNACANALARADAHSHVYHRMGDTVQHHMQRIFFNSEVNGGFPATNLYGHP
jgi:hypothetical protein